MVTDETILAHVFKAEGWPRYTNRPNDRGGPTKGGITLATLSTYLKRPATIAELKALPESQARDIYTSMFISPFKRIEDPLLRLHAIDAGILSGPALVVSWLQELVGVRVDGKMGPVTGGAVNAQEPHQLGIRLGTYRIRFMGRLITKDRVRDQRENAWGWMNRATSFLDMEAKAGPRR